MIRYVYAGVLLHFAKRELETVFVHRFSHGTMPFFNIFKKYVSSYASRLLRIYNVLLLISSSAHYHILSGVLLAYSIYSPTFSANSPWIRGAIRENPTFLWSCLAVFLVRDFIRLIYAILTPTP